MEAEEGAAEEVVTVGTGGHSAPVLTLVVAAVAAVLCCPLDSPDEEVELFLLVSSKVLSLSTIETVSAGIKTCSTVSKRSISLFSLEPIP